MKKMFLLLLFINLCFAQKNITAKVTYEESFGTTEKSIYNLFVFNNLSSYRQLIPASEGGAIQTIGGFIEPTIQRIYNFDLSSKKLIFQEGIAFKTIQAVEEDFKIDWNFVNETKLIGGFNCNKATTKFKGNNYIAWYCEDLPMPFGPWKFNGLPGLILEISDESGYYKIISTKINQSESEKVIFDKIKLLDVSNPISFKKYLLLKLSESDDIYNFYQSISPRDTYLKVSIDYSKFIREPLDAK